MADLDNFIPAIKYGHTAGTLLTNSVGGDATFASTGTMTLTEGKPFIATVSVGTVAVHPSGVTLLAASKVTGSRSVYLTGFFVKVGGTAWDGQLGTKVAIQNSSGGTDFVSWGTAKMTANAFLSSGSPEITYGPPFSTGAGGGAGLGLRVYSDGTITAGTTCTVTAFGFIK